MITHDKIPGTYRLTEDETAERLMLLYSGLSPEGARRMTASIREGFPETAVLDSIQPPGKVRLRIGYDAGEHFYWHTYTMA